MEGWASHVHETTAHAPPLISVPPVFPAISQYGCTTGTREVYSGTLSVHFMEAPLEEQQFLPLITPELLVATCTPDGERLHCNEAWTSVFGTDGLWGSLPEEDARFAKEYLADSGRGLLVTHQVFLVDRPGRDVPCPVLLHFLPVRLADAAPGKFPIVITGEVLQEPVSWAADQTRRRRMELLGQMTMGIAHDFNNLLTTILGHVELLQLSLADIAGESEVGGQLRTLEQAAGDGAALVKKIQQYIRHEKLDHFEHVELHHLVDEVLTLTRPYWYNEPRRQGISILVEPHLEPVPPISGFANELREVVVNLILNAIQAMPAGGTLRVRTKQEEAKGVILEVEDTGVGMSERVKSRIFEPLYSTKGEDGTGMGLTVSYGIVQEHNGAIEVDSYAGRGTCFRLAFPLARTAKQVPSPAEAHEAGVHHAVRILVVDDEPMVRAVTAKLLRLKGHDVMEAESGQEALERFDEGGYDLVLTDLSMPEMSGRELAHHLRKKQKRIPILLLTGDTDAEDDNELIDGVVKKPYKLDDLEAVIQRVLSETA